MISLKYLDFNQMLQSLKGKVKARCWNFGSQLKHRCSLSLDFIVFCTVDLAIEFNWREGVEIECVVEVLHELRFETLALSSKNLLNIGLSRFPLNFSCSSHWLTSRSVQCWCRSEFILEYCTLVTKWIAIWTWSWTMISLKYLDFNQMLQSLKVKVKARVLNFGN